jgi:branched-chain amino acid transport system permease protein
MQKNIRSALVLGVVGGFVTFLFGGWSVAILGVVIGVAIGLTLGRQVERRDPIRTGLQALPTAATAAGIFLALSLIQNYVIAPSIGASPSSLGVTIAANLIGSLGLILLAVITTGLHGLPLQYERTGKLILLGLLIAAFPFVDSATGLRWTAQIIFALIFVILGLGLNIVVGFAGLLDLGYAAFFAIGAYTTGILSSTGSILYFNNHILLNFWLVIWIAAAMAGISGILLGTPTLPLRGDYLAIVTLGFGEIIPVVFRNLIDVTIKEPFTCWILPAILKLFGSSASVACITFMQNVDVSAGEKGINPIGRPSLPLIGEFQSDNPITWYFLIVAIILLSIFLIRRLRDSRLGRAWMAIREDELAAAQMGIDPVRTKLLAFAMGATFSGFAGAFYAAYIRGIFPTVFDFSVSIIVLVTIILGGLGNINGVIVGGLIIMTADRLFLPALKDFLKGLMDHTILPALASNHTLQAAVAQNANPILYRFLLFGLTLVIMMALRPEGLIPSAQRRMELHADEEPAEIPEASQEAARPKAKAAVKR